MKLSLRNAAVDDLEMLVQIRNSAMCESLGRFAPFNLQLARENFRRTVKPLLCNIIEIEEQTVGFISTNVINGDLSIEHLYIIPEFQRRGIGGIVLRGIIAEADARSQPIRLTVLSNSEANYFYRRYGFVKIGETGWYIYYVRNPSPKARVSESDLLPKNSVNLS